MGDLPLVIPSGARFSCHMCGACCRNFTVDLDAGERERIARHDWSREGERFAEGFTVAGADPWDEPCDELKKQEDGACVFLDEDGLCLVEKRLGREAKPRICRKFPYVFIAAPDGERVAVSIECASRFRSLVDGAPVERARADLEALAPQSEPHRVKWRVQVAADARFLTPEEYLALEARLAAEIDEPRPLAALVGGLGAAIEEARRPVSGDLEGTWDLGLGEGPEEGFDHAWARLLVGIGKAALSRGGEIAGPAAELAEHPGSAWRAVLAAAEATAEGAAFVRAVLAGWLHEALPGRNPNAEDGVGQMIAGAILLAALARELAREAGEDADGPSPERLNLAAREVSLFFRNRSGTRVREATGGFAPICRAAAGLT
jgi:Fe-S-cluster containining protein